MSLIKDNAQAIVNEFLALLGESKVESLADKTKYYRNGIRSGGGDALAVVFPSTLLEYWRVLQVGVANNCIIILQAANTGLTEGSTPAADGYDRHVVIINTLAMDQIVLLNDGQQILAFPGATLHQLENRLKPIGRSPHSVIGSSAFGATITGGVANNSGGALVKRGPAYTEMSLFARVNERGELLLVNHLGIELGDTPEEILNRLEQNDYDKNQQDLEGKQASDREYISRVRDIDAASPARFNADKRRLYEASGCAGKIAVFAVRLDTFPKSVSEKTFYIGTNSANVLTELRRHILADFDHVPEVGEYMHRDMFKMAKVYGKDSFISINLFGTKRLARMYRLKAKVDLFLNARSWLPSSLSDHVLQALSRLFPNQLPKRLLRFHTKYEHHLILKMSDAGISEAESYLSHYFGGECAGGNRGEYFICDSAEASKAYLHRFVAAAAPVRYVAVKGREAGKLLSLDIAIRRNDLSWREELPDEIKNDIECTLYYGHFFCHVFHHDYILKNGANAYEVKKAMLKLLDQRGAKYPAEHNVGHLYDAESDLKEFYRELDPTNTFNPGIGRLDKHKRSCACC